MICRRLDATDAPSRGLPGFACLVVFVVLVVVPSSGRSQPGGVTGIQGESGGAVSTDDGSAAARATSQPNSRCAPWLPQSPTAAGHHRGPDSGPRRPAHGGSSADITGPGKPSSAARNPPGGAPTPVPPRPLRRPAPTQQAPAPAGRPAPSAPSAAAGEVSPDETEGRPPEAAPGLTRGQQRGRMQLSGDRNISMDFDQVDIKTFIKFMSELTGRNFVVDEKVRAR